MVEYVTKCFAKDIKDILESQSNPNGKGKKTNVKVWRNQPQKDRLLLFSAEIKEQSTKDF